MNVLSDITDDEFMRFLQNLGVETYKLSFEWMLNDTDFAGVLRWIYNSLDHNNALSAREEYRCNELQKNGALLSPEDLEDAIASIVEQYPGICLPGDQESKEAVEMDVHFQEERLAMLERQEAIVKSLIKQNDLIKEQLSLELTQLNSAHRQWAEDEDVAADECMKLAQEMETLLEGVVDVVTDNLEVYANSKGHKDTARRFITFSPVESYQQCIALFRSHHDLFVSKHLGSGLNSITEELQAAAAEAKGMERSLSDAAFAYVKSKADLSGQQAKLAVLSNYNNVHPSQITNCLLEARSALELLEQEENIAEQQARTAVEELAKSRTDFSVNTASVAALHVRQQIQTSLTCLVDVWHKAFTLDRILYYCLRRELSTLEEFVQFATDLRQHLLEEANAVAVRIDAMNEICSELAVCSQRLQTDNPLLQALCTIIGLPITTDASLLVKAYNDLRGNVKVLEQNVQDGYSKKEHALFEFKNSAMPLQKYIWSGCTKQAHCWDLTVASLSHTLKQQIENVDQKVQDAIVLFGRVKSGDKKKLRKLWQLFLTDPARFLAAMRNSNL